MPIFFHQEAGHFGNCLNFEEDYELLCHCLQGILEVLFKAPEMVNKPRMARVGATCMAQNTQLGVDFDV